MSTDRTPIEAHLADDTLLLLGDVTDEAALTELVDALTADDAFGDLPGTPSGEALVAAWRHLTGCTTCETRQHALLGTVVQTLGAAPAASNALWAESATDARIAAALDALAPSAAAVADNLQRREAPTRRSWFGLGRGAGPGTGTGADGISVGGGGAGAFTGRRLLIIAAVAAVAVGTIIALRPKTSQVGALKVSADTTAPADGFSAERAQPPAKKAATRNDAEPTDAVAALDEPAAGAGLSGPGANPPTTLAVGIAGTVPAPTPAPDAGDEAAAAAGSAEALSESPATSAPATIAPIEAPIVGAAPPPAPAPSQAAVPAPAKKIATPPAAAPSPAAAAAPQAAAVTANASDGSVPSLGSFADANTLLDRFVALHPATSPLVTTAASTAAPAAAAALPAPSAGGAAASSAAATPGPGLCPGRVGDFRSAATVDGRPVTVLRVREGSTDVDIVLDASSCNEVGRRTVVS